MKKNKGFTLIELLAVIVVLAVIALIATPLVLNMVNTAKKGAAEVSANAYIKALENSLILGQVENGIRKQNGIYNISSDKKILVNEKGEELELYIKGQLPKQGQVVIENNEVKSARMCINNHSVDYDGNSSKVIDGTYCESEFTITFEEYNEENVKEEKINITGKPITTKTFNIENLDDAVSFGCDNGAIPKIEKSNLIVENILYGNTKCTINDSLEKTIEKINLDNAYIIMYENDVISKQIEIGSTTINDKNVTLDLNEKILTYNEKTDYAIRNYGTLNIIGNGKIVGEGHSIKNIGTLNIDGGTYNLIDAHLNATLNVKNSKHLCTENKNSCAAIYLRNNSTSTFENIEVEESKGKAIAMAGNSSATVKESSFECPNDIDDPNYPNYPNALNVCIFSESTGKLALDDVSINSDDVAVQNSKQGTIDIKAGKFISNNTYSILNSNAGIINIRQEDKPIYISTSSEIWGPAILNNSEGTINITGIEADECNSLSEQTTSGLCVYADVNNDTNGNAAIQNFGSGNININGGTYVGYSRGVNNNGTGTINVSNAKVSSGKYGFVNNGDDGTINICNSTIIAPTADIFNGGIGDSIISGKINYSTSVTFNNGTNEPSKAGNSQDKINSGYTGTCS